MAIGSNPLLNEKTFASERWGGIMADLQKAEAKTISTTMTTRGVVIKSSILLVLTVLSATVNWVLASKQETSELATMFGIGGGLFTFVTGWILFFKQNLATYLAVPYAIAKGFVLGWFSLIIASLGAKKGIDAAIVINAVLLTFGCFVGCIAAYGFGWVRLGRTMRTAIFMGVLGICFTYLLSAILPMFGVTGMNVLHSSGPIGIAFSGVVIVLAVLSLLSAIQFIDEGVQGGAPKYMEWYAAYALIMTLAWLYIEILSLLNKLRNN